MVTLQWFTRLCDRGQTRNPSYSFHLCLYFRIVITSPSSQGLFFFFELFWNITVILLSPHTGAGACLKTPPHLQCVTGQEHHQLVWQRMSLMQGQSGLPANIQLKPAEAVWHSWAPHFTPQYSLLKQSTVKQQIICCHGHKCNKRLETAFLFLSSDV